MLLYPNATFFPKQVWQLLSNIDEWLPVYHLSPYFCNSSNPLDLSVTPENAKILLDSFFLVISDPLFKWNTLISFHWVVFFFSVLALFCYISDIEFSGYNISIPFRNFRFLLKAQSFLFMEHLFLILRGHSEAFVLPPGS